MALTTGSVGGAPLLPSLPSALPSAGGAGQGIFSRILEQTLNQAAQQNVDSNQAVLDLAAGRTDNLQDVVMQVAKSDLTFRLLLEIRNRLSDAYQEIAKMQMG